MDAHFTHRVTASVTSGGETLHDDSCLFTPDGQSALVVAESPRVHVATGGEGDAPVPSCSVLMVALSDGTVIDSIHLPGELLVRRQRHAGATWSLCGNLLVLLLQRRQEIRVYRCTEHGFVRTRTHGEHVHADDAWVLEQAAQAEELHRCVD
jgi:hypothetical protein